MMTIFPETSQTIILPYEREELLYKIEQLTDSEDFYFQGVIDADGFSLQELANKQANYAPIIKGKIEDTRRGCLLFLDYKLLQSSRIMIGSWLFGLSFIFFLLFTAHQYSLYTVIILLLLPLHSLVAHILFRKEVKRIKRLFNKKLFE
ncbi:hypothetical protein [Sediminitomix flava]|uniref:Uncharacterized protein n=1 Tax=Sediminitomix flava TaxID=379075 RepID=A0A315Z4N2_SEDFL|nr:hypothetical protein [Sediminitomix flava]PWJ38428.1 hypothetical protein BC781_10718 [Sediminitomix flava]